MSRRAVKEQKGGFPRPRPFPTRFSAAARPEPVHPVEWGFPAPLNSHDASYLRYRWRGLLARQGHRGRLACGHPGSPRAEHHHDEARSLYQCGSGHHVAVPARRGLCHRRRRRDRPGPGPLRAFRTHPADPQELGHHRPHLRERHPARAPRRLSGRHRAGDPAHHRRNQEVHLRGDRRLRRRPGRDRRHGRRHRVLALPGGDPPDPHRTWSGQGAVHAPDPGAVHRRGRRAQDQADPAFGQGTSLDRYPARHPALPQRAAAARGRAAQDRAVHQRGRARGDLLRGRGQYLQAAAVAACPAPR